jgi:hypothetical protein
MDSASTRRRPFGIKIIIVLQLIYVALLIMTQLDILVQGQWEDVLRQPMESHVASLAVLNALILVTLITVAGLWQLKHWAWVLLMVQIGVSLGLSLWAYFSDSPQYGAMAIGVITVFYLNQSDVRRAFSQ